MVGECRQRGIHYPHVSGIAGQSKYGAQSVVISGGYEDDEDHGEWFLYTGRFVRHLEALIINCIFDGNFVQLIIVGL